MAVVTKYGRGYKDPNAISLAEPAHAEGQVRVVTTGPIAIANGDSAGSRHYLAKIPSSAIIMPQSTLYHEGVTGCNDYDIGVEKDGAIIDADVLADGLDISAAGTKSVVATSGATGSIGKRLWELLGLAVDPAVEYDIVGTMKAAATAAKMIEAVIYYAKK